VNTAVGPRQSKAAPGRARLIEVDPNPTGGIERLFLLAADCVDNPIHSVENPDTLPRTHGTGRLRVFHFNDLHNHLTDLTGQEKGTHRFSQMVKRVRDARREKPNGDAVLFLSVGDDHTGSVLDELLGWRPEQFVADASYHAYSHEHVDATVLGNHEFDRGAALLATGIRQDARFPVLSANVHSSIHLVAGQDYHPAAIAISGGLRIGLLGLTTHVETRVAPPDDPAFAVASPVRVLQNILPTLAPLVDVVLILSHCGFGDGAHQSGKAAAARDIGEADFSLARAAAAITKKPVLVLGAHTHTRLNADGLEKCNVFDGVPVVQSECNGRHLGEIDLQIGPELGDGYQVSKICLHQIKPRNDAVLPGHADFDQYEQTGDYDQAFETKTIAPLIDQVQAILTNEIAQVSTDALSFKSAVQDRYKGECSLLSFMADAVVSRLVGAGVDVDFSLINAATIHAGIEPGSLSMGAWFDVMPYADQVFIARISGADFENILQNNAKRLLRPDEVAKTDCSGFVGRGFVHMSHQVRYQIDPGAAAQRARSVSIKVDGRPIAELHSHVFNVAMPTYLALGAFGERWNGRSICGGVPGDLDGYDLRKLPSKNTGLIYRDEIAAFICASGKIDGAGKDGRLQIIPKTKGNPQP